MFSASPAVTQYFVAEKRCKKYIPFLLGDSIYRYTAGILSMEEGRLRKNDVMAIVDDFDGPVIGSEDNMKIMCIVCHRVV